jgi:hypothetical protein
MPVIQPTTREMRYEQRCSKKMIENQKGQRLDRYEKRCALRDEAKSCVSLELNDRIQNQDRNQNKVKIQNTVRSSTRNPTAYGFFGSFF